MPDNLTQKSLGEKIEVINENLNEIKNIQKDLIEFEQKNNAVLMKKIRKLQEYNEVSDITNQVFEKRICNIEKLLKKIIEKLSA